MTERIRQMAEAAVARGSDRFPAVVPERAEDSGDLSRPVEIGKGLYRYLAKQPVEVFDNELIVGRNRFTDCDYPSDLYNRNGHGKGMEY